MEIKFMVNWANQEVANIEEYNNEYVCDVAHNFEEDDEIFDDWLAEKFTVLGVFNMSEEDKKKIRNDYKEYCRERADEELTEDGWELCVMEI